MAGKTQGSFEHLPDSLPEVLLPQQGVKQLADRLTEYMTLIGQMDIPEVMGQVLDDFLLQCSVIPEELDAPDALDQIVSRQLAVTLAFQLGRLEGKSPQLVDRFLREAFDSWGTLDLDNDAEIGVEDFNHLAEKVLPKLRRWNYQMEGQEDGDDNERTG